MSQPSEADAEQRTPEELRAEIEQTREELGETVQALAEKTDVKARAQDRISDAKTSVHEKKDEFVFKAKQATPASAGAGAQQVAATVQQKPVPFTAAGAFAGGMLMGWLLGRRSGD